MIVGMGGRRKRKRSLGGLVTAGLKDRGLSSGKLGVEERTTFVFSDGVAKAAPQLATLNTRIGSAMRDPVPSSRGATALAQSMPAEAPLVVGRFEELVALAEQKRDLVAKTALERDVRLVHCEDGRLEVALEPGAAKTLVSDLARKLSAWTGRRNRCDSTSWPGPSVSRPERA